MRLWLLGALPAAALALAPSAPSAPAQLAADGTAVDRGATRQRLIRVEAGWAAEPAKAAQRENPPFTDWETEQHTAPLADSTTAASSAPASTTHAPDSTSSPRASTAAAHHPDAYWVVASTNELRTMAGEGYVPPIMPATGTYRCSAQDSLGITRADFHLNFFYSGQLSGTGVDDSGNECTVHGSWNHELKTVEWEEQWSGPHGVVHVHGNVMFKGNERTTIFLLFGDGNGQNGMARLESDAASKVPILKVGGEVVLQVRDLPAFTHLPKQRVGRALIAALAEVGKIDPSAVDVTIREATESQISLVEASAAPAEPARAEHTELRLEAAPSEDTASGRGTKSLSLSKAGSVPALTVAGAPKTGVQVIYSINLVAAGRTSTDNYAAESVIGEFLESEAGRVRDIISLTLRHYDLVYTIDGVWLSVPRVVMADPDPARDAQALARAAGMPVAYDTDAPEGSGHSTTATASSWSWHASWTAPSPMPGSPSPTPPGGWPAEPESTTPAAAASSTTASASTSSSPDWTPPSTSSTPGWTPPSTTSTTTASSARPGSTAPPAPAAGGTTNAWEAWETWSGYGSDGYAPSKTGAGWDAAPPAPPPASDPQEVQARQAAEHGGAPNVLRLTNDQEQKVQSKEHQVRSAGAGAQLAAAAAALIALASGL